MPFQHTTLPENCLAARRADTPDRDDPRSAPTIGAPSADDRGLRDCRCTRARHEHGTCGAYRRDGCRCAPCRAANAAAARRHRRRVAEQRWGAPPAWAHSCGTTRRLQALAAMGWSTRQLAARLGVTGNAIASLRGNRRDRVLASTAAAITALYEDCWWRTPPGRSCDLARAETWALRQGWADPSRWADQDLDDPDARPGGFADEPDPIAVAEAVAGRPVALTRSEQRAVAAELTRRGASAQTIAAAIGRTARTVVRYRGRGAAA